MSSPTDTITAHPAAVACDGVASAVDVLAESVELAWSAADGELCGLVKATDVLIARLGGAQTRLVAECAARDLPGRAGATGGAAWLSGLLTARPVRAGGVWRLATDLAAGPPADLAPEQLADVEGVDAAEVPDSALNAELGWVFGPETTVGDGLSATTAALTTGRVDADQAAVIAKAVTGLPVEVDEVTGPVVRRTCCGTRWCITLGRWPSWPTTCSRCSPPSWPRPGWPSRWRGRRTGPPAPA